MSEVDTQTLSDMAETLLFPLYLRATESQRPDAMIRDEKAVALVDQINYDFSRFKFVGIDEIALAMRTRQFDRCARDFLARFPDAVVVHIGPGLDTRFERVDNGRVEWYDLDLPEVIELRRKFIGGEKDRYHLLSCSVLDNAWLDVVSVHSQRPFLFMAEGVLMYFEEAQVKSLVLMLLRRFPGSELVCDVETPLQNRIDNLKLARNKFSARIKWSLKLGRDLESWGDGISLLEEWFYIYDPEPRLDSYRWIRHFPFLAKAAGVFRYRLGKTADEKASR